LLYYYQNGV